MMEALLNTDLRQYHIHHATGVCVRVKGEYGAIIKTTNLTYWYMSTCSSARMMSLSSSMLSPGETPTDWSS